MSDDSKFFWGAATSAHQVEGGNANDWTEWEIKNAKLKSQNAKLHPLAGEWSDYILKNYPNPLQEENYISGRACDHYNRFREDFDIAKSLGHNAHRFGIEWSRIEPEEGKWNEKEIEHYREVIRALRERGLEPFVTLWHWPLPIWLEQIGGVEHKKFPDYFTRYVEKVVGSFKDDVRFWITLNEPEIFSLNSYLRGMWPPQKKSLFLFYKVLAHLIKAHRSALLSIKKIAPRSSVGVALNLTFFESGEGIINRILTAITKKAWNSHFLNHIRASLDFIGLNYYFHNRIKLRQGFGGFSSPSSPQQAVEYSAKENKNENKIVSDMNWEMYPEGIYRVLKDLRRYQLPIYITENGVADARDVHRSEFLKNHINWMKKAINEGVDVRGYFHWSLIDNFEWDKGFWPRFGLVEIDYSAKGGSPSSVAGLLRRTGTSGGKTLTRKIRPSALEYKKIIENSKL